MKSVKALIVDANFFGKDILIKEIKSAIEKGVLRMVLSKNGKLAMELRKAKTQLYIEYSRQGKFYDVCEKSVKRKTKHLKTLGVLKSDDHHVIALAIVSGANTLVSADEDLCKDFKNWKNIDRQSSCISHPNPPSKRDTKIINKKLSLKIINKKIPQKVVNKLIDSACVNSTYCECQIRDGGC